MPNLTRTFRKRSATFIQKDALAFTWGGHHLVGLQVQPRMVENQVHLEWHENHVHDRIQGREDVPGDTAGRDFEKSQEFEAGIDEGADAEEGGPDSEEQRPVALVIFADQHFDGQLAVVNHWRKWITEKVPLVNCDRVNQCR